MKNWTSSGTASIATQGNRLRVDSDCTVEIESLTSETNCVSPTDPATQVQNDDITAPIIGAVVGVMVFAVVTILAVIISVNWLQRQGRCVSLHQN